ncbi:hypothetical protein C8R45DRAFT_1002884, partial [Mycena sanguinolenta]
MLLHSFPSSLIHSLDEEMPPIPEEIVPNVVSELPTKTLIVVLVATTVLTIFYYMLPLRLANILDAVMTETKRLYDNAHEMGLRFPTETEMDALRRKVYLLVHDTRRNSDSWRAMLHHFLRVHTFIPLYRIYEVKKVKAHITISMNSLSYAPKM